jgi:hypothetical protein
MSTKHSLPAALFIVLAPALALAQVEADVETGVVFSSRNDARVPGDGGSDFSPHLIHDPGSEAAWRTYRPLRLSA